MPRLDTSPHNSLVITNLEGPVKELALSIALPGNRADLTRHLTDS
jgi:hypothetical protein